MKKILPLLLLLFSIISYASEINGSAFLDNSSDHSGILIKFNPVSPTAVYVEGTSDSNGLYSITVINGVYNISYEKTGYQTYTLTDQLISADITLTNVTLNLGTVVNVSGNVSGNWTNTNTYIVNGDITIPTGQTLNIEKGTQIKFDGYYSLIVNGTLKAIGDENNIINFSSNKTNPTNKDWNQIRINSSSISSEINYCLIDYGHKADYGDTGLINIGGEVVILNSKIRNSEGTGIKIALSYAGDVLIDNCEISNCDYGIYNSGIGNILITNNKIFDLSLIGIYENIYDSQTIIKNNIVHNCSYSGVTSHTEIKIERNILYNNGYNNPHGAGIFVGGGTPIISNNTVFSNRNGIGIYDNDFHNPEPIINSNIIINNSEYGIYSQGLPKPSLVAYNLIYNNTNGVGNNLPSGVGTVITTNSNGTGSDAYYNIFSSPELISTNPSNSSFCELNSNSDAINAGDPNLTNNYNSTIIDIGAKESSVTLSINKFSNNDFTIFPNPVINQVKIQAKDNQSFNKILIYNINGQLLKEYKLENSSNNYTIENLNDLTSGIYIMKIFNNLKKNQKMKLLKK
ncbi:right-handed parallel beta-helix repeat-containing protein [uncultured Wocania sp.]|uniref:right-handed parallel beta-helix repeat-containing protein n=1 Tax=uncultured Wocania sp. TaxID=2834404 RepID=UPI0030F77F24